MPRLEIFAEDHMQYAYGIYLFTAKHPLVRKLKKVAKPSVHGHKTWSSSFLLMDWLSSNPLAKNTRVLELGCGWGPAAVYCASQQQAKVTGLDVDDSVFPYLDMVAAANDAKVRPLHASFNDMKGQNLAKFDCIIGADICFWDEMVSDLLRLFKRAKKAGVKQIILADPGRSTFDELTNRCEKLWPAAFTYEHWFALEPNRFEGRLMILDFTRLPV
ncbi:methyltransferase [Thalassolituus sp. C2-1]|uniref:class I SAM-dependent methyltransferase n=1 Tax=Venatorbacter sp. C2-1 TaxID=2597518 RepID=UPI001190110B|nr:methyltransferase domain-containing protein [Thalassolituus sp. C2-1]TVV44107.1 methyltransferase domain-containing protein [Thalassolituus sp. C2-1]